MFIGNYLGEFVPYQFDTAEHERRTFYNKYGAASYIFNVLNVTQEITGFIDGEKYGNVMRFVNH